MRAVEAAFEAALTTIRASIRQRLREPSPPPMPFPWGFTSVLPAATAIDMSKGGATLPTAITTWEVRDPLTDLMVKILRAYGPMGPNALHREVDQHEPLSGYTRWQVIDRLRGQRGVFARIAHGKWAAIESRRDDEHSDEPAQDEPARPPDREPPQGPNK